MSIEWADPPMKRGGSDIFSEDVKAELRAHPGRWALIRRSHPNASVALMFVRRNPGFEMTTRRTPDMKYDLYARFMGDES